MLQSRATTSSWAGAWMMVLSEPILTFLIFLCKQTTISRFRGSKELHSLVTMLPDAENSLFDGSEDAGTHKYFLAILARSGKTGSWVFHQARTSSFFDSRLGSLKQVSSSTLSGVTGPSRPRRPCSMNFLSLKKGETKITKIKC